jgi:hypothetical protein
MQAIISESYERAQNGAADPNLELTGVSRVYRNGGGECYGIVAVGSLTATYGDAQIEEIFQQLLNPSATPPTTNLQ